MNLREQLLFTHSKENTALIVHWIGNNPKRFDKLMNLFLQDEYRVVQRSAWVLSECGLKYPSLLQPYLLPMIFQCEKENVHVAVKRNVTRVFQAISIPENCEEPLLNLCFDLLINPHEAIAVRAFSMGILSKLCQKHPDLKNELRQIIENALQYETVSVGFRSKAKRTLKEIAP